MVRTALKREPDQELFRPEAILFAERFCVDADADPAKQNLEQVWRNDPELFASQYMNDPLSLAGDQFSIPRLKAHVIERGDIPLNVNLCMTWDLAYSMATHSDYSVGVLGGYSPNGSLYVVDIVRGRFRPAEIIEQIISHYRRWPIYRLGIEKDQAASMLAPGLEARYRGMGLYIPVDFIPVKLNGMYPEQQILALGPLFEQNKLWFCSSAAHLDEMFREFSRYPKYTHDDICRAVSLLVFYRGHRPELTPDPEPVLIHGAQVYGDGECGAGIVA
jgi:predicted phage terminase large subunit-like protein